MSSEMKVRRKKRRRTTQVYPTEKPSIYVILACLLIGVSLLVYFFNPYNQITSPLPPQPPLPVSPTSTPVEAHAPVLSPSPEKPPAPTNAIEQPIPAPTPVPPGPPGQLAPARPAIPNSSDVNPLPASGDAK